MVWPLKAYVVCATVIMNMQVAERAKQVSSTGASSNHRNGRGSGGVGILTKNWLIEKYSVSISDSEL